MLSAVALALAVASVVLIRGGIKGYDFADSFRDVFSKVPAINVAAPVANPTDNSPNSVAEFPPAVEQWRELVASYFPSTVITEALSVMECESSGNPNAVNPTSQASGLFQHLPKYWNDRSSAAGIPGANIMDPVANVRVAAWLYKQSNSWSHWECKPSVS